MTVLPLVAKASGGVLSGEGEKMVPADEVTMTAQSDWILCHIVEALYAGVAEAQGDEHLAKRLRAQVRLRLMMMSDVELCQLANILALPFQKSVERVHDEVRLAREQNKATLN